MSCLYHQYVALLPISEENKKYDQRTFKTACGVEVTTREYEAVLLRGIPCRGLIDMAVDSGANNAPLDPDIGDCVGCYPNVV